MDRIVLGGCLLLVALGALLGLGINTEQSTGSSIRLAMELLSFAGTAITGVVAIIALTSWHSQFRHAEKFKALKDLKDSAYNLHAFRGYLFAVQRRCLHLMASSGMPNESFDEDERLAHQQWLVALKAYNVAWGTAVIFLSEKEEATLTAPAYLFTNRSVEDPLRIVTIYANSPGPDNINSFNVAVREITDYARHLSATAVKDSELLLRKNFKYKI